MYDGLYFWLLLLAGAGWVAWAPRRVREAGLALLAIGGVLYHDIDAGVAYLGLGTVVWLLVRRGRPMPVMAAVAVIALALGLAGVKAIEASSVGKWHAPLGLSYLVFRLIQVVVDARRRAWERPPTAAEFGHFLFTPALFVAGPLERWGHWQQVPTEPCGERITAGVWRVLSGLTKKLFIADKLLPIVAGNLGWSMPGQIDVSSGAGEIWQASAYTYLHIYAEFSGYSDIAVGAALLWSRRPMENFNWPVIAATPVDFWRRWHISIAQWCADCVYLPVMGLLRSVVVPMLASFVVMGLWHSLGWNRVGWAVWQVAGLLVFIAWQKRMGRPKVDTWRASWAWRLVSIGLTQAFVIASYTFIMHSEAVSVGESLVLIARMLGWSP